MYTEGFENLEEAESESHYKSSSETDRLLRENEKLKKSLEKEQFFNKLLDQEIQELKSHGTNGNGNYPSEYWTGKRRVSRSAFYTLLFITLVMAGYIGYGIYYDKKFDYLNIGKNIPGSRAAATTKDEPAATTPVTSAATNANEQPKSAATSVPAASQTENVVVTPPPAVKDSVPNIIGNKKPAVAEKQKQKAAVAVTPDDEYNEDEVNKAIQEPIKPVSRPAAAVTKPAVVPQQQSETASTQTTVTPPAASQPAESRPVIGRYRITSKANFYNAPDENTMRSTFISESANKIVNALEDKNGFIFVEYTNDLGFTSKGWLSKKDLAKE